MLHVFAGCGNYHHFGTIAAGVVHALPSVFGSSDVKATKSLFRAAQ